jgi:hypothetical protein
MGGGDGLQMLRVAADMFNKQLWIADRGGYPAGGLGKERACRKTLYRPWDLRFFGVT